MKTDGATMENSNWNRYIYPSVRCSAIYNSQDTETPKCPPTEKRTKIWHIYAMEFYSAITKNETMPFAATWGDLEIVILSEVRHRKTNIICYHLNVETKQVIQTNLFTKQKHRHRKQIYGYQREKVGEINEEFGIGRYKPIYIYKIYKQQGPIV